MENKKRVGLSLSGGGYRAAAFHLGTLNKLHQLKLLEKVDVISTISGGSITGVAWLLSTEAYGTFSKKMADTLARKSVIRYVLLHPGFFIPAIIVIGTLVLSVLLSFTSLSWLSFIIFFLILVIILRFQYSILPVSRFIEKAYDKFFFEHATLNMMKGYPTIAVGSSNLHTGRPFTFSQARMGDSAYKASDTSSENPVFKPVGFPVAKAVTASSCVPFAFSPVTIPEEFFDETADRSLIKPQLIDGGVYDNQGIQKLTQDKSSYACDIIITSDAGGNFKADKVYPNTIALLIRTVDLFMYRIKAFQMQKNIYQNVKGGRRPIAYFSLGWEPERCISGFVDNLKEGTILPEVVASHNLEKLWLTDPEKYCEDISEKLKQNSGYDFIAKLTAGEWETARKIGTNLTSLGTAKVGYLIKHAECLTELQLRLYCPMFFSSNHKSPDNE